MNFGDQSVREAKIFGIGLRRTGTKSLAGALNLLGIRTKWFPQDAQTYRELIMGEYRLSILRTSPRARAGRSCAHSLDWMCPMDRSPRSTISSHLCSVRFASSAVVSTEAEADQGRARR